MASTRSKESATEDLVGGAPAESRPTLQCSLHHSENEIPSQATNCLTLHQVKGKKSSFLLEATDTEVNSDALSPGIAIQSGCFSVASPAHFKIESLPVPNDDEGDSNNGDKPSIAKTQEPSFMLGGFQLISNAKQIEVYTTDMSGKESYIMTSKAIIVRTNDDDNDDDGDNQDDEKAKLNKPILHKAVCVIPGGPKQVRLLHIKLLSLQHTETQDTNITFVQMLRVTARIPDPKSPTMAASNRMPNQVMPPAMFANGMQGFGMAMPHAAIPPAGSSTNLHQASPTMNMLQQQFLMQQQHQQHHQQHQHQQFMMPPSPASNNGSIDKEDLGAAMTTMSILARSTEERMEKTVKEQMQELSAIMTRTAQETILASSKSTADAVSKAVQGAMQQLHSHQSGEPKDDRIETLLQRHQEVLKKDQEVVLESMFAKHISPLTKSISKQSQVLEKQVLQLKSHQERTQDMEDLLRSSLDSQKKLHNKLDEMTKEFQQFQTTLDKQREEQKKKREEMIDLNDNNIIRNSAQPFSILDQPMSNFAPRSITPTESTPFAILRRDTNDAAAEVDANTATDTTANLKIMQDSAATLLNDTALSHFASTSRLIQNISTQQSNFSSMNVMDDAAPSLLMLDQTMATLPSLHHHLKSDEIDETRDMLDRTTNSGWNLLGIGEDEEEVNITLN